MTRFILVFLLTFGCNTRCAAPARDADRVLAVSIGQALARACPLGEDPADEHVRDVCADRLGTLEVLAAAQVEPFIWGGQGAGYSLERGTTQFDARVWRRLYASTFMFSPRWTVEAVGAQTILHVPVTFRGAMPAGAYPYPFWHSEKKWNAYTYATAMHLVIEHGRVLGALRGSAQDQTRPKTAHTWDGVWDAPPLSADTTAIERILRRKGYTVVA